MYNTTLFVQDPGKALSSERPEQSALYEALCVERPHWSDSHGAPHMEPPASSACLRWAPDVSCKWYSFTRVNLYISEKKHNLSSCWMPLYLSVVLQFTENCPLYHAGYRGDFCAGHHDEHCDGRHPTHGAGHHIGRRAGQSTWHWPLKKGGHAGHCPLWRTVRHTGNHTIHCGGHHAVVLGWRCAGCCARHCSGHHAWHWASLGARVSSQRAPRNERPPTSTWWQAPRDKRPALLRRSPHDECHPKRSKRLATSAPPLVPRNEQPVTHAPQKTSHNERFATSNPLTSAPQRRAPPDERPATCAPQRAPCDVRPMTNATWRAPHDEHPTTSAHSKSFPTVCCNFLSVLIYSMCQNVSRVWFILSCQ